MRRLFEEIGITKKPLQRNSKTALDGWDDDANHCFKEGQPCSIGMTVLHTQLDMLWCNFVLGAIFFPLFKTHYHTLSYITIPPKQRIKICTKDKIAPQQIS